MRTISRNSLLIFALGIGIFSAPAWGLVEGLTDMSEFSNPASDWYGMNADYVYTMGAGTAVAVGNFSLLTANHYWVSYGYKFTINGDEFEVIDQLVPPVDAGETVSPDVRILKLRNNTDGDPLPGYYDLYSGSLSNAQFIHVGTGHTGTSYTTYYTFDDGTPREVRWGTNDYETLMRKRVDGPDVGTAPDWSTWCFRLDYNTNDTQYEVGLADHDSGSGYFINDGGTWKVAGIGLYVYTNGVAGRYDENWAASLPAYSDWLSPNVVDAYPGDYSMDGIVNTADYTVWADNFGWSGTPGQHPADGNRDGAVNTVDYVIWADRFGEVDPHMAAMASSLSSSSDLLSQDDLSQGVPEPATLLLFGAGALALLRRRRCDD